MKFSTVKLDPNPNEHTWDIRFSDLPYDRQAVKNPTPHSLGFFHYPTKWGKQKGFDKLKQHMIQIHKEEIAKLQESLAALETLEIGDVK